MLSLFLVYPLLPPIPSFEQNDHLVPSFWT
jgi:hypothetical protein